MVHKSLTQLITDLCCYSGYTDKHIKHTNESNCTVKELFDKKIQRNVTNQCHSIGLETCVPFFNVNVRMSKHKCVLDFSRNKSDLGKSQFVWIPNSFGNLMNDRKSYN